MFTYVLSATNTTGGNTGSLTGMLIPLVIMFALLYFLMIRPESKRKKEAEEMRNNLKKGDWLTTIGGIYGRVVAITDRTVVIETSEDRVRMEFLKSAIGTVGTLEEQAAAAQRPGRKAKEKPAEEEIEQENVEE
jgi:preprotein translocase subunit YajC